jgi:hypothetical protein
VPLLRPEPLNDAHEFSDFFCGIASLDDWLKKRARPNQVSGASRTFVVADNHRAVGYYALASGAIAIEASVGHFRRNCPILFRSPSLAVLQSTARSRARASDGRCFAIAPCALRAQPTRLAFAASSSTRSRIRPRPSIRRSVSTRRRASR